MRLPEHGANPHHVYERVGIDVPERVLDFSENVNPAGPPSSIQQRWPDFLGQLSAYPDPQGEPFLTAAADFHGVSKTSMFAGNGAAELLALIAERYRGKRAVVVHPTFSEYEATLTAKHVEIVRVTASAANAFRLPVQDIMRAMDGAAVLYLCTPNNPTGILPEQHELATIIRHAQEIGCEVVLDEAFIDFVDESLSFIAQIKEHRHVLVVRSMTKMYAIPGIRLGYVIADPTIIQEIKALAPHWNVNGIAAQIGTSCLQEEAYRQQAIDYSNRQRESMKAFLQAQGCIVTDSVTNFLSFKPPEGQEAQELYRMLLEKGIVLRHTENFRGMDGEWLRIGMKNEADMALLQCVLEEILSSLGSTKLTFISGGVRSGKSAYAEQLLLDKARQHGGRLVYIASGTVTDPEMQARIARHQQDRAIQNWTTMEQPMQLENVLPNIRTGDYILWDCVTTWLANELFDGWETGTPCIAQPGCMEQKWIRLEETLDALLEKAAHLVIVSNEVQDEWPAGSIETEKYRQWIGQIHQKLVDKANTAIEMDYGIPTFWKGGTGR
jgi:threonine-phosphate decarboxylase